MSSTETDCLDLDVGARLGEGEGLDAVFGQVVGGRGGPKLEAVVPSGEEEVGFQSDQLLEREVVARHLPNLFESGGELGREGLVGGQAAAGAELPDHMGFQTEGDQVLGGIDVVGYGPGGRLGVGDRGAAVGYGHRVGGCDCRRG